MHVDYLIIGQGLCGSWLSYWLLKGGAKVLVIDGAEGISASHAASGIINPITGKRLARQWMAEVIDPFVRNTYAEMSDTLGVPLTRELPIHVFFRNEEEAAFFERKASGTHDDLLAYNNHISAAAHFNYHYGAGTIYPALLVAVKPLLLRWRAELCAVDALQTGRFDWSECRVHEGGIAYEDITARAVIDCSGAAVAANNYFNKLPFALNKGEAFFATIPDLPPNSIRKYAQLSIVPSEDGRFWIGSSYDWDFKDILPTTYFRERVTHTLNSWLRLPYTLHEHVAAVRPATVTRDAFSGMHPAYPAVGILNGMGSKGCSLAPFLAHNLARHLLDGEPIIPQVDVCRYARALSR